MKDKGFYIKSIIATGENKEISRVDFTDGCNLLFGPSEMGKSSVFSLINYMLGSERAPKLPPEGNGYDTFYMEFVTKNDNKVHVACRVLNDHNVIVKDCTYDEYAKDSIDSHVYHIKSKKSSYSQYLMQLNGFSEGLEIKKSNSSKVSFTYTWIRHLILADENRIVSESPIFYPVNEPTSTTQQRSVIYYLTTGVDDSDFTPQEKPDIRNSRYSGMIELTKSEIEILNQRIQNLGDVSYADFYDEDVIKSVQLKISETEHQLDSLYDKRKRLEDEKKTLLSNSLFVREFIKRMKLLHKHYITDLQRYEYLYNGASLFRVLTESHTCPVCHSEIKDKTQFDEEYLNQIQHEYNQVMLKLDDVKAIICKKENEELEIIQQLDSIKSQLDTLEGDINNFTSEMSSINLELKRYQDNIEKKAEAKFLQEELQRLYKKLDALEKERKAKPASPEYNRQTTINEEFCQLVQKKLIDWNVITENEPIVFDENGFDFVIGGKGRLTCGKGARGVTCSAILMSLLEFCKLKNIPFSDVMVLDSPITAHFSDNTLYADETTQSKFFKYCNENIKDYQLIIIDNKAPNIKERETLSDINYIEFSEDGRNGFYLGKTVK